ncbi:heavy metal translocating P-type ATPase [Corynebacterium amycolatum]|uniref:heavy metal translocating P-type ATPase n=1 Tax=Corynebacterium amycolatum TaxID=43765 RepID=UPI00254CE55C|nr:HAD family hydrolase [Corynebacterium amycolatum]MDK7110916.1 HAD family hydrolase [Corynebacterium amycolatum]
MSDTGEFDFSLDNRVEQAIVDAKVAARKALPRSRQDIDEESAHQRLAHRRGQSNTAFALILENLENAESAERAEHVLESFPDVTASVVYKPGRAWITAPDTIDPNQFIEALREVGIESYLTRSTLRRRATRLDVSQHRRPAVPAAAQQNEEERIRRREAALRRSGGGAEVLFTARELVTKQRFWGSLFLSIPVLVTSLNVNWQFPGWQWMCLVLTTIVAWWGGWPFHRAMAASLRRRMSALDGASSIAILLAWLWSLAQLIFGPAGQIGYTTAPTWFAFNYRESASAEVFFDVACGLTVLLLTGRMFTRYNKVRTGQILRNLRIPAERNVTVVRKSAKSAEPKRVEVTVAELNIGDDIVVPPHSVIPVDGSVIGGASTMDAQLLGIGVEPQKVKVNSKVWAGAINLDSELKVRVERTGFKTRASSIARWLRQAVREETVMHQTAVHSASELVPWTLSLAGVAFCGWWLATGTMSGALAVALAMLSGIAPVALAMSTSTVQRIGILAGASNGILIRGNETFRKLATANVVIFNRVGTLTEGDTHVLGVAAERNENPDLVLRVAGALMMESNHPASAAIVRACRASRDAGSGGGEVPHWIETVHVAIAEDGAFVGQVEIPVKDSDDNLEMRFVEGRVWRPRDLTALSEKMAVAALSGGTPMVVSWRGKVRGVITIGEDIKPDAVESIDQLEDMGVDTMMITRDPYPVARRFADRLNISRVFAGIIASRKAIAVRSVHSDGETVVMVGDKDIRDSLRAADVGVLMDNTEGNQNLDVDYADVVALRNNVLSIPEAIEIARAVVRMMDSNIYFAWFYNVAVILLGMTGMIHPLLASLLMIFSSLWIDWRSRRVSSRRKHLFRVKLGRW